MTGLRRAFLPYGSALLVLAGLIGFTSARQGVVPIGALAATASGALVQAAVGCGVRHRPWRVPYAALITGLLVGALLPPGLPVVVPVATSALAVGSKFVLRAHGSPIFNPAAVGLLLPLGLLGVSATSWSGPSPTVPWGLLVLAPLTVALASTRRLAVAVPFGAAYAIPTLLRSGWVPGFSVGWMTTLVGTGYFAVAFLMVADPRTSPWPGPAQAAYGAGVGLATWALAGGGIADPFLYALLVGNLAYALIRHRRKMVAWAAEIASPDRWASAVAASPFPEPVGSERWDASATSGGPGVGQAGRSGRVDARRGRPRRRARGRWASEAADPSPGLGRSAPTSSSNRPANSGLAA
ncbi:MAG TPA: RnfABCDGE type electron transport complex subunit D [Thermoplasmata archaeon]|nr:RnfABCDGE type electron transport complex subunit D [Thermoplasmata archaeon]